MPEPTCEPATGPTTGLADLVRRALASGLTGAGGERLDIRPAEPSPAEPAVPSSVEPAAGPSVVAVDVDGAAHDGGGTSRVGRYRLTVDERRRTVDLHFVADTYEYRRGCVNLAAVHAGFVAALDDLLRADLLRSDPAGAETAATRCTLRAKVDANHAVWVRFLQWQDGYWPINAANLRTAVEYVAETGKRQTVWDATGLADRIRSIAGADPHLATGAGSWRHLVESTPPAALYDAIDEVRPGLARAVFAAMPCWYGQQVLGPATV